MRKKITKIFSMLFFINGKGQRALRLDDTLLSHSEQVMWECSFFISGSAPEISWFQRKKNAASVSGPREIWALAY
jgi:hypothetical protein